MRNSLRMIQCTLYGLLIFALSGCGASNTTTTGLDKDKATGKITANLVLPKSTGKTVALQADVTKTRLTVTGAGIPTAKQDFATNTGGTIEVYPGSNLIIAAQAFNAAGTILYEGFATNVTIVAGTNPGVTIQLNAPVDKLADRPCLGCHETTRDKTGQNLVADFKQSGHYINTSTDALVVFPANGSTQAGCAGCHGTSHNDLDPVASGRCATCHTATVAGAKHANTYLFNGTAAVTTKCNSCHNNSHNTSLSCIGCHAIAQNAAALLVGNTNDGVRAITGEFAKRSHHVTGRSVKDSDCAVCHLEGKKKTAGDVIVVDYTYHANNGVINLRNGNSALTGNQTTAVGAGYPWDPATPNHTLMDQFCFSCHNEAGAPTAVAAIAGVAGYTGAALNPFGDSVSNDYDQVSRVNVVGVYEQFDTGNSSHHAVRGAKYSSNNLTAAQFTNISTVNANTRNVGQTAAVVGTRGLNSTSATATNKAQLTGTMFETGKFTATYTTLNNAVLADNSVLHCGDCHTVGQFRAADVSTAAGSFNKAVIGAHGSQNEYMLRNSNGDDTFSKDALVCYICHKEDVYSVPNQVSAATVTNLYVAHNSVNNSFQDCNGNFYNTAGMIGTARLVPEEGAMDNTTFQTELADGKYYATGGGNIFGIKCIACHNASDKKTFGGIHGNAGNASYTTYSGAKNAVNVGASVAVERKPYRFMPGLGNFRYNGGDSADQWALKTVATANKQGCYTLNGSSAQPGKGLVSPTKAVASGTNVNAVAIANDGGILGSWGACTDHTGTSTAGGRAVTRTLLRPLTY